MDLHFSKNISNFFVAGINYKKSDASVRGQFAINKDQYSTLLESAPLQGLSELFILSTCNRTEIYGFATNADQLIDLLCSQTIGNAVDFRNSAYIKNGRDAVEHIFAVGAGLDSQILGDYEIVGQLKTAVRLSKHNGFVGNFTERLINCVLQSSKLIKNTTSLSGGTVSVSFAAIQYIRNNIIDPATKNILLLGVGKIGSNTCKNLVDYLNTKNITLINRSPEKANDLAQKLGLHSEPVLNLSREIKKAGIILIATNSPEPIILKEHLEGCGQKLIIDLSIPYNVEQEARKLSNIKLINVDELSKLKDETLKKRESEIPKAKHIINQHLEEFYDWYQMRQHAPLLKDLKGKLKEIYADPHYIRHPLSCAKKIDVEIQRVVNDTAGKIKIQNKRGCQYINAISEFISAG